MTRLPGYLNCVIFLLISSFQTLSLAQDNVRYKWRVVGNSQKRPNEIMQWGSIHDSEQEALDAIEDLKKTYYGGLLNGSTDKPINLKPQKKPVTGGTWSSLPRDPNKLVLPIKGAPKPGIGSKRNSDPNDAVGEWKGTEGGNNAVRFTFDPKGGVTAYDKFGTWQGSWKMIGNTTVFFELTTPNIVRYSGQITNGKLNGVAFNPKNGSKWSWSVSKQVKKINPGPVHFPDTSLKPSVIEPENKNVKYVIQLRWRTRNSAFTDWHWNNSLYGKQIEYSSESDTRKKVEELERQFRDGAEAKVGYVKEFRIVPK